jgi:hypothetical protein
VVSVLGDLMVQHNLIILATKGRLGLDLPMEHECTADIVFFFFFRPRTAQHCADQFFQFSARVGTLSFGTAFT